jgi:hypothetical protein
MPHTIPPFPEITHNGVIRQPGNLSRALATPLRRIHKQLRADVSNQPDQLQQLVCSAFQRYYDVLLELYVRNAAASQAVETPLGEKTFHLAKECGWLPKTARLDNQEWRDWMGQLVADRVKWVGFEDCSDPYLFVPFPKGRDDAEISETQAPADSTAVAIAKATGDKRQKPGPAAGPVTAPSPEPLQDARVLNDFGDRRALVEAYIEEVFQKKWKRITRTEIWKKTRYKTRAEFERWESYWYEKKRGGKTNKSADTQFRRILTIEKPHLK